MSYSINTLFPPSSWLRARLPANAALHADQAGVPLLCDLVYNSPWPAWINAESWSTPIVFAAWDQPYVPVRITAANEPYMVAWAVHGVPIPPGTMPSPDGDGELTIYQPNWGKTYPDGQVRNGRLFEFWGAHYDPSTGWSARQAGRIVGTCQRVTGRPVDYWDPAVTGRLDNGVWASGAHGGATRDGRYEQATKLTTAAHVPLSHTIIRADDLDRGVIDHPVAILTPVEGGEWAPHVWPATGHDAGSRQRLPHGARLRLPPDHVPDPTKPPLTRMLEVCARDHGLVHQDTASGCVAIRAEQGTEGRLGDRAKAMREFSWDKLQRLADGSDTVPTPVA